MNEIDHLDDLYKKRFRVAIFGSARITKNDPIYDQIYKLAKLIAAENIDVVTGGGPGIMDAANSGHQDGRSNLDCYSIGLNICLPDEQKPNLHLDIKKEFHRFSKRLDTFMALSNAVIVAPGGVGTLLEFAYTWQLLQVKHIADIPIILLGDMWKAFVNWIREFPLKNKFIDIDDLLTLFIADDIMQAFTIVKQCHNYYLEGRPELCNKLNKNRNMGL
jgi:uncharacterized protein (TIGR00730 family)